MTELSTATDAPRSLRELLDALPQELYDQIYEEAFTAPSGTFVVVDKYHKPPALLQVDRVSRAKFAESYYARTVFVMRNVFSFLYVERLSGQHVNFLKDIRVPYKDWDTLFPSNFGHAQHWTRRLPRGFLHSSKARKNFWDLEALLHRLRQDGLVGAQKKDDDKLLEWWNEDSGGEDLP